MICNQKDCDAIAEVEVFWPGNTTKTCRSHAASAMAIAAAMGFELEVRKLPTEETAA